MNLTYKFLIAFITLSFSCSVISGQKTVLETVAPGTVRLGDEFYVKYSINKKVSKIQLDRVSNDFRLVSGPSQSTSASLNITNGVTTQTEQSVFTYTLVAEKTGTHTLPIASIIANSQKYLSDTVSVEVLEKDSSAAEKVDFNADSLFVELLFSKPEAYKQEPVIAQLKLFSQLDVSSVEEIDMPPFDGFLSYELSPPAKPEYSKDTIAGEIFNTVIIKSLLLLPVKSGNFKIGAAKVKCTVRKPKKNSTSSLFDDFFNSYSTEKISICSDSGNISVKDFPATVPEDFTNICGNNFKISVALDQSKITVNEPFVFEINISGSGNLKLIGTPDIKLPVNLKLIKSEYNNNLTTDSTGISGQRTFSYTLLPATKGKFSIPSYSISYYNPETKEYRQVSSPEVIINAEEAGTDYPVQKINYQLKEQTKGKKRKIETASIIVLDMSESMSAQDLEPNRKSAVINALSGYLKYTKHETGLVLYSEVPYLLNSISSDNKVINDSLLKNAGIKLGNGTATGFGISKATDELRKINARHKNIILITDGASNSGSIDELMASEFAVCFGIKISIIGVSGSGDSAQITMETTFGEQTTTIPITINDKELEKIAGITGGNYFRATDSISLYSALKEINKAERQKSTANKLETAFTESEINSVLNLMYQDISEKNSEIKAMQN
jgi:hypothetical protein